MQMIDALCRRCSSFTFLWVFLYVWWFEMTDDLCKRCSQRKVALSEIIQTGHSDRYQSTSGQILE
ncbi:hypothetical protein OROHE_014451 [Orobanche hederae]